MSILYPLIEGMTGRVVVQIEKIKALSELREKFAEGGLLALAKHTWDGESLPVPKSVRDYKRDLTQAQAAWELNRVERLLEMLALTSRILHAQSTIAETLPADDPFRQTYESDKSRAKELYEQAGPVLDTLGLQHQAGVSFNEGQYLSVMGRGLFVLNGHKTFQREGYSQSNIENAYETWAGCLYADRIEYAEQCLRLIGENVIYVQQAFRRAALAMQAEKIFYNGIDALKAADEHVSGAEQVLTTTSEMAARLRGFLMGVNKMVVPPAREGADVTFVNQPVPLI